MRSIIIQARLGSTRLLNKILLPFYEGKSIFQIIIETLLTLDERIIVATSNDPINDPLVTLCKQYHVDCYRGDENDVLNRFIMAAEYFGVDKIIRICSDNPLIELDSIKTLLDMSDLDEEYVSFSINGKPSIKTHFGFWAEYVSWTALKKVQKMTSENIYNEHVTNFIYSHPHLFSIKWIEGPDCILGRENIRLTIDTIGDFLNVQSICNHLFPQKRFPKIQEVVAYLDEHPEHFEIMEKEILRNSK